MSPESNVESLLTIVQICSKFVNRSPNICQVHYVNFPEDATDVRSTLADNARWANTVRQRLRVACLRHVTHWLRSSFLFDIPKRQLTAARWVTVLLLHVLV